MKVYRRGKKERKEAEREKGLLKFSLSSTDQVDRDMKKYRGHVAGPGLYSKCVDTFDFAPPRHNFPRITSVRSDVSVYQIFQSGGGGVEGSGWDWFVFGSSDR